MCFGILVVLSGLGLGAITCQAYGAATLPGGPRTSGGGLAAEVHIGRREIVRGEAPEKMEVLPEWDNPKCRCATSSPGDCTCSEFCTDEDRLMMCEEVHGPCECLQTAPGLCECSGFCGSIGDRRVACEYADGCIWASEICVAQDGAVWT